MEGIILIAVIGTLNIACFFVGAKIGNTVAKGESIETPSPIKAVHEYKEHREQSKRQRKIDTILENIDNYDGTEVGQKDIPRG